MTIWADIAISGSVIISWVAVLMAVLCLYQLRKQSRQMRQLYQRLNHNLELANSGSIGMGQRLLAMEKKLKQAVKKGASPTPAAAAQPAPAFTSKPASTHTDNDAVFEPYNHAASMLNAGIDAEEVAKRCGLSRAEASLMQLMRQQLQAA